MTGGRSNGINPRGNGKVDNTESYRSYTTHEESKEEGGLITSFARTFTWPGTDFGLSNQMLTVSVFKPYKEQIATNTATGATNAATGASNTAAINTLSNSVASCCSSGSSGSTVSLTSTCAKESCTNLWSNVTNIYSHIKANRDKIKNKCTKAKCDKILAKVKKVKAEVELLNMTVLGDLLSQLQNNSLLNLVVELQTNLTTLQANFDALQASVATDIAAVNNCFGDTTSADCPGSANGQTGIIETLTNLETSVAGKCDATTCTALDACMKDPTSTDCTNTYSESTGIPTTLLAKCDDNTCTGLDACMSDPTSSSCSSFYSESTSIPTKLAAKCDTTMCTTLTTDVSSLKTCMQTPTTTGCTSSANGGTGSVPATLATKCDETTCTLLTACMTTPADASCTITDSTSVPTLVTQVDKCMTSIDDSTCTSSYGATANLINNGGTGMVGWIQQFKKPSAINCELTTDTAPTTQSSVTANPDGCSLYQKYTKITWDTCEQTEPDATNKYHMEIGASKNEFTINQDGYYDIEMSVLLTNSENYQIRANVLKVSSKDSSCAATAQACTLLIQTRAVTKFASVVNNVPASNFAYRTMNGEGVFKLCAGDKIVTYVTGSQNANAAGQTIRGDAGNNKLTITKVWYS